MNAAETYSVVGVRHDGVRVVIDEGIASDRAHLVRLLLIVANAYPDVIVEPDTSRLTSRKNGACSRSPT